MKLEVGKTYRTADNVLVTIVKERTTFPFVGSDGESYQLNGRLLYDPCQRDLVAEVEWRDAEKDHE